MAVATPEDESSSSGDESTPLEKGEAPAGLEYGPTTLWSPRREANSHRCWALPATTGGTNPGHGSLHNASTHQGLS